MFVCCSKMGGARESCKLMTFNTDIESQTSFRVVGTIKLEKIIIGTTGPPDSRGKRHVVGVPKEDLTNNRVKIG